MTEIRLRRDGAGGYVTRDGRFTLTRTTMGGGVNMIGGWSDGHTAWSVDDTSGAKPFGGGGFAARSTTIADTLWEARNLLAAIYAREQS